MAESVVDARRRGGVVLVVASAALLFGACSPADQSAITKDRESGAPQLVLALCPGETVSAAQVAVAAVDADGYAIDGEVLWRVVAERPRRIDRITAGVTPEGFIEVTSGSDFNSQDRLVMTAEVDGGLASGHGVYFDPDTLAAGKLQQYDQRTSGDDLVRAAKANCSDNPLDALALSPMTLVVLGAMFIAACVTAGLVPWALMRRSERRREALIPASLSAVQRADEAQLWQSLRCGSGEQINRSRWQLGLASRHSERLLTRCRRAFPCQ